MNTGTVDSYLQDGCGRCDHYQTPQCKVLRWTPGLVALREVALASGLVETMKWGSPCYTLDGKNVAMLLSLRESYGFSFFKGAAMADPEGVLESAGPNSQHGRILKFRDAGEASARRAQAAAFLDQAIALERAGIQTAPTTRPDVPAELEARLAANSALRAAFDALTPGRQRSHILHVSGAKATETRARRAEACAERVLAGRGFNER
jgi:uncharacterized protein YdeI (YjbR/CyaY-like superfamily)